MSAKLMRNFSLSALAVLFMLAGPACATDLTDAVKAGNIDRVALLLKSGADPNKRSTYNGPLHDAARLGSAEIATILIRAGADMDCPLWRDSSQLMPAAMAGQAKMVTILIASGAKADSLDNTGRTPLLSFMSGDISDVNTLAALLER